MAQQVNLHQPEANVLLAATARRQRHRQSSVQSGHSELLLELVLLKTAPRALKVSVVRLVIQCLFRAREASTAQ